MELVVIHHGLWGSHKDLEFIEKSLLQRFPHDRVSTLNVKTNGGLLTYEGIEVMGLRVLSLLENELEKQQYSKISFIGYSLGGLVLRWVVGQVTLIKAFDGLEFGFFVTFATPHLGLCQGSLTFFERFRIAAAKLLLFRTGAQIMLHDFIENEIPLLAKMTVPGSSFMLNLAKFRKLAVYFNVVNDPLVPIWTSSINQSNLETALEEVESPYPSIVFDTKYIKATKPSTVVLLDRTWIYQSSRISRYIFLLIFPILVLPISLVTLTVLAVYCRIRFWVSRHRNRVAASIPETLLYSSTKLIDKKMVVPFMAQNLNQLEWHKIGVKTVHARAHAAIIRRSSWFRGSEDIIDHFLDNLVTP